MSGDDVGPGGDVLARWSTMALWFTCTVGVCMGLVALAGLFVSEDPAWMDTLQTILLLGVMAGGVTMGLLGIIGWSQRRKAQ